MKLTSIGLLLLLGFLQGSSFLFIKIAVESISPLSVVFLRVLLALPFIYIYIFFRKISIREHARTYYRELILLSLTSIILPFLLITIASETIPSGIASVYMALIPIFVVLFEIFFRKELVFGVRVYTGFVFGFLGVCLLAYTDISAHGFGNLTGHSLCLISAVSYAFSVFKAKVLSDIPPIVISFLLLLFASIVLFFPFLFFSVDFELVNTRHWFSIFGLSIISTAGALMLMYFLIDKLGTVFTATTNYLVPIYGIILGAIFLDEKLTPLLLPSIIFVLLGLYMVSYKK